MKTRVIIILIILLPFAGKSYTWELIGPDSVNVTDICFGVAMPYMVLCAENGMYLYNYSSHETTFHTNGNLPIQGAAHLNADKFIVVMGDGSWSDGIYKFNLQTQQFEVIEWIPNPAFLYYCEQNSTYYAGFHYGGLYSSADGLTWSEIPYFNGKSCVEMCSWEEHLVVSEQSNINNIHWSADSGDLWTLSENSIGYLSVNFNHDGVLYAIIPEGSMSSGLYKSFDYGNIWDIEFWWFNLSTIGFDVFGNKFVGLKTQAPDLYGLAFYEINANWEPSFIMFNEGLGNIYINKIKTNPVMSALNLFVCTEGGVYYSYDIVIGEEEKAEQNNDFTIFPNPIKSSNVLNISIPQTDKLIDIQLFSIFRKSILEKNIVNPINSNIQLELPDVEAGIYYLYLSSDKENFTRKLVIK